MPACRDFPILARVASGKCIERGLPLTIIPGPSSILTALVGSGFSLEKFCFRGFLPVKSGEREREASAEGGDRADYQAALDLASQARARLQSPWVQPPRSRRERTNCTSLVRRDMPSYRCITKEKL
jgi:hypothetical protein